MMDLTVSWNWERIRILFTKKTFFGTIFEGTVSLPRSS